MMNVFLKSQNSILRIIPIMALCAAAAMSAQTFSFTPGVTRVAGTGTAGYTGVGGPALSAAIHGPRGIVQDAGGNLYMSDSANNVVDRIDAATGQLTTYAGGGTVCSTASDAMGDGCPALQATLKAPDQLTIDKAGNLYIADFGNSLVREVVASSGQIVKILGGGSASCTGSTDTIGDGCLATQALAASPQGVALDGAGNIYESDSVKNLVRKIDATTGIVTKFAGTGTAGLTGDNGVATSAKLSGPAGLWVIGNSLYVADKTNSLIRKVDLTSKIIITFAGTNNGTAATSGNTGDGGAATSGTLDLPTGVAGGPEGSLYIADFSNNVIRAVSPLGILSTYAGAGTACAAGDTLGNGCAKTQAKFTNPYVLSPDVNGAITFADYANNELRRVSLGNEFGRIAANGATGTSRESFVVVTVATTLKSEQISGTTEFTAGAISGCTVTAAVALGTSCGFNATFLPKFPGTRGASLLLSDASGGVSSEGLRGVGIAPAVSLGGGAISMFAGTGKAGNINGGNSSAQFSSNGGVAVDSADNIYVADSLNSEIRLIANGLVSTVAGTGVSGYSGDGDTATAALLNGPQSPSIDAAGGRVLIADTNNHVVRALSPQGTISAVAGTGTAGYSGDGAAATAAKLTSPKAAAADYAGNVYIADTGNNVVRRISLAGIITTIAGTGTAGYTGDTALATAARLSAPAGIVADLNGNLFIADTGNNVIRQLVLSTGIITTVAGTGTAGYSGDGGPGNIALLNAPTQLVADAAGGIYIADTGNHAIRYLIPGDSISTLAGTGASGYTGDGDIATSARLNAPKGIGLTSAGDLLVSDTGNDVVRVVARSRGPMMVFGVQAVGTISPAQTVPLSNTGNGPLSISSVTATTPFAVVAGVGNCAAGSVIAPGSSCALSVTYKPTSTSSVTGTLTVTDDALGLSSQQQVALSYTFSADSTTTALTLSPTATTGPFGTSVTLTATVSSQASNTNPYTGSVAFSDGVTALSTVAVNSSGVAILTVIPAIGAHSYTANFQGDSGHGVSQSASSPLTIVKATSTTTLSSNPTSAQLGSPVTLTATVSPQVSGTPTGNVTFSTPTATVGTQPLVNGVATLTLSTLPAGLSAITAVYAGDTSFAGSTSNATNVTITTTPDFSISVMPGSIAIPAGHSGVLIVNITPVFAYAGTISVTCVSLPANVQCRFIPSSLTANGTNTVLNGQMLITTGGASATQSAGASGILMTALMMLLSGLLCDGKRSFPRRFRIATFALLLFACGITLLSGCSSGMTTAAAASPGTSAIVLTATGSAGDVSHSANISLTVQ